MKYNEHHDQENKQEQDYRDKRQYFITVHDHSSSTSNVHYTNVFLLPWTNQENQENNYNQLYDQENKISTKGWLTNLDDQKGRTDKDQVL